MSPRDADALDLDDVDPPGPGPDDPADNTPDPADQEDPEDQDDEPEEQDEPADPAPADPALAAPRAVPRSESRIRSLIEESRKKDQDLAEVRARLDALSAQVAGGARETPEQRATRLALLPAEERIREEFRESQQQHTRDMQLLHFQLAESSDKASFESKATVDPLYRKWAPEVERELASLRRKNQNVPRQELFYYLIGKASMEARGGTEAKSQRRAAENRVRRATTRPSNGRSDVAPEGRTRQQQSLEKRLENVVI